MTHTFFLVLVSTTNSDTLARELIPRVLFALNSFIQHVAAQDRRRNQWRLYQISTKPLTMVVPTLISSGRWSNRQCGQRFERWCGPWCSWPWEQVMRPAVIRAMWPIGGGGAADNVVGSAAAAVRLGPPAFLSAIPPTAVTAVLDDRPAHHHPVHYPRRPRIKSDVILSAVVHHPWSYPNIPPTAATAILLSIAPPTIEAK
jgi:hypothetical protein